MSDFFRIVRGLEINETIRLLHTSGPPGGTSDTDTALIGSICMNDLTGDLYTKRLSGPGANKWFTVEQPSIILYDEKVNAATPPAAQADNSIALGSGAQTDPSATNALAIGNQSLARVPGSVVQASGRFGTTGDAQAGRYLLRGHTVNANETEIFIDGTAGSQRLTLPDDCTWTFKITFTGHRTDIADGHAGFVVTGVAYRDAGAGTTMILGKISKDVLAKSNRQWDVNVTADTTNGSLKLTCTGQAGKTIRWVALVETVEVTN